MTTAISYVRVSSAEQAKGYSLTTQQESVARYCEDHDLDLVATFTDTHTGTELDRPGLNAALDAVRDLKPGVVVMHDVDRLGREMAVQAVAEKELTRYGAKIAYVLGGTTDDGSGILLKGVKQALAIYENYQRVERSRRGKNGRVQDGSPLVGPRPPYGYAYRKTESRKGVLEVVPEEAEVIRQMYRWCAGDKLSSYKIAQRLNAEATPTRGDDNPTVRKKVGRTVWGPDTIAKILRSETNIGQWHWGKTRRVAAESETLPNGQKRKHLRVQEARPREEWRTIAVEPIVDEALWHAAQRQLDHNILNNTGPAKRDYLLRGRVRCGSCGRSFCGRGEKPPARAYYRCSRSEGQAWHGRCDFRFGMEQQRLEGTVLDALKAFLLDPEARAAGLTAEADRVGSERDRAASDLDAATAAIKAVDIKLGKLVDAFLADTELADVLTGRKRELMAEKERELRKREAALRDLAHTSAPDLEAAIRELGPIVDTAFAHASPDELRHLLDLLRVDVTVLDRDRVRLTGVVGGTHGDILTTSRTQSRHDGTPFGLVIPLPQRARTATTAAPGDVLAA